MVRIHGLYQSDCITFFHSLAKQVLILRAGKQRDESLKCNLGSVRFPTHIQGLQVASITLYTCMKNHFQI